MQPLSQAIVDQFSEHFSAGRRGLAKAEIGPFFRLYEPNMPIRTYLDMISKPDLFYECVAALSPEKQRTALWDLCQQPPPARGPMPGEKTRMDLLAILFHVGASRPVGVSVSLITLSGTHRSWWEVCSHLPHDPAATVTAARSFLETVCKTMLHELGQTEKEPGKLNSLLKQTTIALGITPSGDMETEQVMSGLRSVISGIAGASNAAGRRHGLVAGHVVQDEHLAELIANAAGAVAVFLTQRYVLLRLGT